MQAGEAGWRSDEFAGIMHEALLEAFAGALDLDPAELEAMLTSGEKIVDIAVAQGLTAEEAWDIMKGVREQVRTELLESGIDLPARGERMKGNMPFGCDGECAQDGTFPRQGGRWGGFPEGRFSDS
jgi:hypothetical protein